MPGNENMTLAEVIRAGLGLGSGQERRFTATLGGGEVYDVRLYALGQPDVDGDRGVTSIDHRGTGNESDGVTSIDRPRPTATEREEGGRRPDKTLQLELTRRP